MSFLATAALAALLVTSSAAQKPRYLFTFGDSYSATDFFPLGAQPNDQEIFGNPPYPGQTTSGIGKANWVGHLAKEQSPANTLCYNFAFPGATVNNSEAVLSATIPDFPAQVTEWEVLMGPADDKNVPWTADNSAATVYFGTNDIFVDNTPIFLNGYTAAVIVESLFNSMTRLYNSGVRKFVLFNMDPLDRAPLYATLPYSVYSPIIKADVSAWNNAITFGLPIWKAENPGVQVELIDTQPVFNQVLDNPTAHGAPNNFCTNYDGVSCLWFNYEHPGQAVHLALADAAHAALTKLGFYS